MQGNREKAGGVPPAFDAKLRYGPRWLTPQPKGPVGVVFYA